MAKGHQRDLKREAYWRGIFGRFQKSGQTVRGFCAQNRLQESSFYAWRREIHRRDAEGIQNGNQAPPAFVPVLVREDQASSSGAGIVIELHGGPRSLTLRLPMTLPIAQVAELVSAITAPALGSAVTEVRA